jgi:hypothetical protein
MCLRYQRDKYTAVEFGISARRFVWVNETSPDISRRKLDVNSQRDAIPIRQAFSIPSHSIWTTLYADFDAPAGKQTPRWDIHSVGAGTIAIAFALARSAVVLVGALQRRRNKPRGFDVIAATASL